MIDEMMVRMRPNSTERRKVDQACHHVAALVVGARPVVFEVAGNSSALLKTPSWVVRIQVGWRRRRASAGRDLCVSEE